MTMLPRLFLSLFLLFSAQAAMAASDQEAQSFIQDLAQKAITTVLVQNISDEERNQRFRQVFVASFDIPDIGKFVLARYWRTATPQQQSAFLKEFEDAQVLTWSQRFKSYHGVKLETLGVSQDGEGVWLVDSQILRPQGAPLPVQWHVHQTADGLRITDIRPEGVSMVMTYRDDYTNLLNANGKSIDGLLSAMRGKNAQLSAK